MMKSYYFISDVHLGEKADEEEKERVKAFLEFLEDLEDKAEKIFFVGDLFDFWFEYKHVIPKKYFLILNQLAIFAKKNIEMHYLAGNHDFWLGNFFDHTLGIKTHDNEWIGEIAGKKFYLFHGDGVEVAVMGVETIK